MPTLVRLELDGGATHDAKPLVEGIQDMRFDYGLDTDGNGSPEHWQPLRRGHALHGGDWAQRHGDPRAHPVVERSRARPATPTRRPTTLGLAGTVGPFNDGLKRHVYTAVVNATNRSGPRERCT